MGQTHKQLPEHEDGKTLRGDDINPRALRQREASYLVDMHAAAVPTSWDSRLSTEVANLEDNQANRDGSDVIVV